MPIQIQFSILIPIQTPSFIYVGKSDFFTFDHSITNFQCLIFLISVKCVICFQYFGQHIEIFWKKVYLIYFLICLELIPIQISQIRISMHCKNRLPIFPSQAKMSLTKLSLDRRVWFVTSRLGTGKLVPFLRCTLDADPDQDPSKWCGPGLIQFRIHDTPYKGIFKLSHKWIIGANCWTTSHLSLVLLLCFPCDSLFKKGFIKIVESWKSIIIELF
jgi:hypothetical protein